MAKFNEIKINGSGNTSYYHKVHKTLGIKIYKPYDENTFGTMTPEESFLEYILTKYVEPSGFTSEALAYGRASICLNSILSNHNVMWMKHYEGESLDAFLQKLMKKKKLKTKEEALEASGYRSRLDAKLNILENQYGLTLDDHVSHYHNFIVEKNGKLRIIDFSCEVYGIADEKKKQILEATKEFLAIRLPEEPYLSILKKLGIVS